MRPEPDSVLGRILASKQSELEQKANQAYREEMRAKSRDVPPCKDFIAALKCAPNAAIIAEIKRRSPSRGDIRPGVSSAEMAGIYQASGARAISVLTDGPFFGGSLQDLASVRDTVELPLLRKDFIIDPVQIYEALAYGADAVLLIVAALNPGRLGELFGLAMGLGLSVLVEVHNADEMQEAKAIRPELLGINNRNLKTLEVSLDTCLELREMAPKDALLVAESGIKGPADIKRLHEGGMGAYLIGTSIMQADDPGQALSSLVEAV
jgi:indole-3-glycerol phosphate synthase